MYSPPCFIDLCRLQTLQINRDSEHSHWSPVDDFTPDQQRFGLCSIRSRRSNPGIEFTNPQPGIDLRIGYWQYPSCFVNRYEVNGAPAEAAESNHPIRMGAAISFRSWNGFSLAFPGRKPRKRDRCHRRWVSRTGACPGRSKSSFHGLDAVCRHFELLQVRP